MSRSEVFVLIVSLLPAPLLKTVNTHPALQTDPYTALSESPCFR
jgi:hypothetical protein